MLISTLLAVCLLGEPDPSLQPAWLAGSDPGSVAEIPVDVSAYTGLVTPPDPVAAEPGLLVPIPRNSDEANFSYSYAELGYSVTKIDVTDHNADAYYLRGSFGFLKYFHVIGGVERQSTSVDDAKLDEFDLGAGVHFPVLDKLDLLAELSYVFNDINSNSGGSDTNTGYMGYLGARLMALPWDGGGLEIDGGYRYLRIDSLLSESDSNQWEIGARVHFLNHFSVGGRYVFIQQDHMYAFDVRFSF